MFKTKGLAAIKKKPSMSSPKNKTRKGSRDAKESEDDVELAGVAATQPNGAAEEKEEAAPAEPQSHLDELVERLLTEYLTHNPADYLTSALTLRFKSKGANTLYKFINGYHVLHSLSTGMAVAAIGAVVALAFSISDTGRRGLNAVFAGFFLILSVIASSLNKKHVKAIQDAESPKTADKQRLLAIRRAAADIGLTTVVRILVSLSVIGWVFSNLWLQLDANTSCDTAAGSWTAAVFAVPLGLKILAKLDFLEYILLTLLNIGAIVVFDLINSGVWCLQDKYSGVWMLAFALPIVYAADYNDKRTFSILKARTVDFSKADPALAQPVQVPVIVQPQNPIVIPQNTNFGLNLLFHAFEKLKAPVDVISTCLDAAKHKEDLALGRAQGAPNLPADSAYTPARRSLKFIDSAIHNVLSLRDLDRGKVKLNFTKFNLVQMIGNLIQQYADEVADKNISVTMKIDNRLPESLVADEKRIREILDNLLSNSFRYSERGGQIKVVATAVQDEDLGASVEIKVADSGNGMSNEERFLLFDPEGQLVVASNNSGSGVGIGLLVCRKVMELHGGIIGVDALEGLGCSFFFRIPLNIKETAELEKKINEEKEDDFVVISPAQGDAPALGKSKSERKIFEAQPSAGAAAKPAEVKEAVEEKVPVVKTSSGGEKRKILLIDDSAAARAQMGRYIQSWEWECHEHKSGKDALEALEIIRKQFGDSSIEFRHCFDVLMVDTDMKGLGGIQTIQRIKELGITAPILAIVDKENRGDFEDLALKAGAQEIIEKPMLKMKLREKLEKLLLLSAKDESEFEASRSEKTAAVHVQVRPKTLNSKDTEDE